MKSIIEKNKIHFMKHHHDQQKGVFPAPVDAAKCKKYANAKQALLSTGYCEFVLGEIECRCVLFALLVKYKILSMIVLFLSNGTDPKNTASKYSSEIPQLKVGPRPIVLVFKI